MRTYALSDYERYIAGRRKYYRLLTVILRGKAERTYDGGMIRDLVPLSVIEAERRKV